MSNRHTRSLVLWGTANILLAVLFAAYADPERTRRVAAMLTTPRALLLLVAGLALAFGLVLCLSAYLRR